MIVQICEHCRQPHALFYWVNDEGTRELSYNCDKVIELSTRACDPTPRFMVRRFTVPMRDDLQIPEVWSTAWAKQKKAERQYQMIMTVPQPKEEA